MFSFNIKAFVVEKLEDFHFKTLNSLMVLVRTSCHFEVFQICCIRKRRYCSNGRVGASFVTAEAQC